MLKISIIIPTFNRKKFLAQAIDSALDQRYSNLEIIVSDNASTDGTDIFMAQYANEPRMIYHRQTTNVGMVNNWKNAIFDHASGEWFLILSDDDYFVDPDFLTNVVVLIQKEPSVVLVYAGGYLLDVVSGKQEILCLPFSGVVDGKEVFVSRGTVFPRDFTLCSVVFNRKLAITENAFSNPNNVCCDSELFLLSCLKGNVGVLAGSPTVYRFHADNLSHAIAKDPILIYGELDMLLHPYEMAMKLGFFKEAEQFKRNVNLEEWIRSHFLLILLQDFGAFFSLKATFKKRIAKTFPDLFKNFNYRVKEIRFFCKSIFGLFFRKIKGG